MRTVALAPGRTGGLAELVPAIAPSRRTLAALTQLRREARWADVVVLRSTRAVPPLAGLLRGGPPLVLVLEEGEAPPTGRSARSLARSGTLWVLGPAEVPGDPRQWSDLLIGAGR
ncbi:MAG TPA: hypothetical protein VKZ55_08790 [Microthrixaceae bacterium]|nr:hypothetical protein [Microthrixaceae bacterium]